MKQTIIVKQDKYPSRQALEAFYNNYELMLNKAGNHPTSESNEVLVGFYSSKLVVHLLMPSGLGGTVTLNRDEWTDLLFQGHLKVKDTMQTTQLVIDTDTKKIAAQQAIQFSDYGTGEIIASMDAMAIYSLEQVEGSLKIAGIQLIFSDPGALPSLPDE